jgi:hypothetical protein
VITATRGREPTAQIYPDHGKFLITVIDPCDHALDIRDQENDMITEICRRRRRVDHGFPKISAILLRRTQDLVIPPEHRPVEVT